jgi:hypothetical protein
MLNPYSDLPFLDTSGHVLHLPPGDPRVLAFLTLDTGLSPVAFTETQGAQFAVFDDGEWFLVDFDLTPVY